MDTPYKHPICEPLSATCFMPADRSLQNVQLFPFALNAAAGSGTSAHPSIKNRERVKVKKEAAASPLLPPAVIATNASPVIDRMVRPVEAAKILQIGRSTLFAWIKKGLIAPPLVLGPRARAWRLSTIQAFLDSRQGGVKQIK